MARIEGFRVKNFKSLKDITLGKVFDKQKNIPLTPLTVVIGQNGVGKSTLFDVFGFLADCFNHGVEKACYYNNRGGFKRLKSFGEEGAIEFEIYYRESPDSSPITYELSIDIDVTGKPYVAKERLKFRRDEQQGRGYPFVFLYLQNGKGFAYKGDKSGIKIQENSGNEDLLFRDIQQKVEKHRSKDKVFIELNDTRKLAITTYGEIAEHPRVWNFCQFIKDWYLSYFEPNAARQDAFSEPQSRLNVKGSNLANVVQHLHSENPNIFKKILKDITKKIPGIDKIDIKIEADERILLCFNDKGFKDPFYAKQMSDGTLKMLAYLLLLNDPNPPPFLCIEEPENGLYPKLLQHLITECRSHSIDGSQIFMTTHSPYCIDALEPEELWILKKGEDGFAVISRASDMEQVVGLMKDGGIPLGSLWYSDYLGI